MFNLFAYDLASFFADLARPEGLGGGGTCKDAFPKLSNHCLDYADMCEMFHWDASGLQR